MVSEPGYNPDLEGLFTYHPPNADTIPKYQAINEAALNLARVIDATCPPSADRTAAIRKVQEARMVANCSIANGGKSYR